MAIKGNRGEWSEFYAFIKILTDGKLFAADEDLNILKEKFYIVLKIIREEALGARKIYDVEDGKMAKIFSQTGEKIKEVDLGAVKSRIKEVFDSIKNSTDTTFEIISANKLMKELECKTIGTAGRKKADLTFVVHDQISRMIQELGFSIKSSLGSPPTLLNASHATNFIFKIVNPARIGNADKFSGLKVSESAKYIYAQKGELIFEKMENETFRKNLRKIDSHFPDILAAMLKYYYLNQGSKISDLIERLGQDEKFMAEYDFSQGDIEYKVKNFLMEIALGMVPSKEWDGKRQAHGGYIIVKEDGEIACYHLYNMDEFKSYLLKNTKFDTPSTTKHGFGKIYKEGGEKKLKLNIQIRFVK